PHPTGRNSAIEAGHETDALFAQRGNHLTHVVRRYMNIAIADHDVVGSRSRVHFLQRTNFRVRPLGNTRKNDLHWNLGELFLERSYGVQSRIAGIACSEYDFECWIVLLEEALQIGFEAGLQSAQRFEEAHSRPGSTPVVRLRGARATVAHR